MEIIPVRAPLVPFHLAEVGYFSYLGDKNSSQGFPTLFIQPFGTLQLFGFTVYAWGNEIELDQEKNRILRLYWEAVDWKWEQ